jgi:hypothetical protein
LRKKTTILAGIVVFSLLGNAYLFSIVLKWQDAWLEQLLTTSEIEDLYRRSSADTSFEAIKALAIKERKEVHVSPAKESDGEWLKGERKV